MSGLSSVLLLLLLHCCLNTGNLEELDLQPCNPSDFEWKEDLTDERYFYYCDLNIAMFVRDKCPTIGGIDKVFDPNTQSCRSPNSGNLRSKRQWRLAAAAAGSGRVGDICVYNTDCLSGMFCNSGICTCLSNFVQYDKYCYEKINPSLAGCIYNEQCGAVWPGSTCDKNGGSSQGVCKCPTGASRAVETADGWVCLLQTPGTCPLPEGDEGTAVLKYEQTADVAKCSVSSMVTTAGGVSGTCSSKETGGHFLGDLYDCIPSNGDEGICCPNRALTCIMPQVSSGGGGETRWYYNSVTGACMQFSYSKSSSSPTSSPNNFKTKDHCESYCQNSCPRGTPQYDNGTPFYKRKAAMCSSSSCDANHDCVTVGSLTRCCPKPNYICSKSGGLNFPPPSTLQINNWNEGVAANTYVARVRYYYDMSSATCKSFAWNQQGGNFNNFENKQDCDTYCSRLLCERGEPLKDASGNNQGCSNNGNCPSSHSCTNGVCCPKKQTVCTMPKQVGTCGNYVQRHWYNAATRDCELFTYSGCQGNANNFESQLDCGNFCRGTVAEPTCIQGQAYKDSYGNYFQCSNLGIGQNCPTNYECKYDGNQWACCSTKSYTCSLTQNTGVSCGPKSVRWFYDTTSQTCQSFEFNGCDGNSNNFANREMCENYCGVGGCPNGGQPFRETNSQTRICSAVTACPTTHECIQVSQGGATLNYCCPTRAYTCGLPPFQGTQCGSTALSRFYFNMATKTCATFTYNGCSGNGNNFATLGQCLNFCNSAACPTGEAVYLDPNTQKPFSCNVGVATSCPNGYKCSYDTLTGTYVCCGSTDMGVCLSGEKAYIDAMTMEVRTCTPNTPGSCPTGFLCRFHPNRNAYFCCGSTTGSLCPAGKSLYKNVQSNQPVVCSMGSLVNVCPTGYKCLATVQMAIQGYCCSQNDLCPNGADFFTDPTSNQPRICTLGTSFSSCPSDFGCQASSMLTSNSQGYCCRGAPSNSGGITAVDTPNVCGSLQPYLLSGQPQPCHPSQNSCPPGYACTVQPSTNTYFCCGSTATPSAGCPTGTQPALVNNQVQTCSPFVTNSCPTGYQCQYVADMQRYQCCGSGPPPAPADGCPAGQSSYYQPGGVEPKLCQSGRANNCPIGYICQFSQQFSRYQCCGVSGGCPTGSVAYISPQTGQPQLCSANGGGNTCAQGYTCQVISAGSTVCCSAIQAVTQPFAGTCPPGMNSLSDTNGGVRQCQSGSDCPSNYNCIQSDGGNGQMCCSIPPTVAPLQLPSVSQLNCPTSGQLPYTIPGTVQIQYCSPQYTNCPQGYNCQLISGQPNRQNYVCCGNSYTPPPPTITPTLAPQPQIVCQDESHLPYMIPGTSQLQYCSPQYSTVCPSGYACEKVPRLPQGQNYVCCGSPPGPNNIIPTEEFPNVPLGPIKVQSGFTCPMPGQEPFKDSSNQVRQCQPGVSLQCPAGYTCQFSGSGRSGFICCGSSLTPAISTSVNMGQTCPGGANVYLASGSNSPLVCTGNQQSCPTGYQCSFSFSLREYYCCSSGSTRPISTGTSADGCPNGQSAYTPPGAAVSQSCSTAYNSCPTGFSCVYNSIGSRYQCCGSTISTQSQTGSLSCVSNCYVGFGNCQSGYVCQWNSATSGFQCCQAGGSTILGGNGCPYGKAYLYPGTTMPLVCSNNGFSNCPVGYSCRPSSTVGQYQCCSNIAKTLQQLAPDAVPEKSEIELLVAQLYNMTSGRNWNNQNLAQLLGGLGGLNTQIPQENANVQGLNCPPEASNRPCSNYEVSTSGCCLPKRLPGDDCIQQKQCAMGYAGTRCEDGMCICPPNMLVFNSQCVKECPTNHINIQGICTQLINKFDDDANNRAGHKRDAGGYSNKRDVRYPGRLPRENCTTAGSNCS